jgi:lysophospholipase L1-like esterase
MKDRLRSSLYGIAVAVAIFGVFEGIARIVEIWHPPQIVDAGLGFDETSRLFVSAPGHPELRTTAPEKRAAFWQQSFSVPKPPGTLRLVAVGESSVNMLHGELQAISAHLSSRLGRPVDLINAGGLSYGSQRLVPIVRELVDYQPDVVVLYLGNNEFEEVEQLELISLRLVGATRAASHLALFRLLRDLWTRAHVRKLADRHRRLLAQPKPDLVMTAGHRFTPDESRERMRSFERNVTNMVELLTARGVKVIMGTIPSNRWQPQFPAQFVAVRNELGALEARGDFAAADAYSRRLLREMAGRHQASDEENAILRRVAGEYHVPFIEFEATIEKAEPHGIPGETLFADHCHLNEQGRALWRDAFQAAIDRLF